MQEFKVFKIIAFGHSLFQALDPVQGAAASVLTGKKYLSSEHLAAIKQLGFSVLKVSPPDNEQI